jgi:hypothetical protein
MPGANARALEKARALAADVLLLDLEDAVAPEAKEEARRQVGAAVRARGYGAREVVVRINGLDTEWGLEDLQAAVAAGPDAILAPKVETPRDIETLDAAMAEAGAGAEMALWVMVEMPKALFHILDIAAAAARTGASAASWWARNCRSLAITTVAATSDIAARTTTTGPPASTRKARRAGASASGSHAATVSSSPAGASVAGVGQTSGGIGTSSMVPSSAVALGLESIAASSARVRQTPAPGQHVGLVLVLAVVADDAVGGAQVLLGQDLARLAHGHDPSRVHQD